MALSYTTIGTNLSGTVGGYYDATDECVWLSPGTADMLMRVKDGIVSTYSVSQGPTYDIVRVGDYLFATPQGSTHAGIIQIDPAKEEDVVVTQGAWAAQPAAPQARGAEYDGSTYIWSNSLSSAIGLIRWDPSDNSFTKYPHSKGIGQVIYANSALYFIGNNRAFICKFNTSGAFVEEWAHTNYVADSARTAAYDGSTYIVFAPYKSDHIITFNVTTEAIAYYAISTPANEAYSEICFDGTDFWLAAAAEDALVQFNAGTGTITYHSDCPGASTYLGHGAIAYDASNGNVVIGNTQTWKKIVTFVSPNYVAPAGASGGGICGNNWGF